MKIRRHQFEVFGALQKKERRAALARELADSIENATVNPESGNVEVQDSRGATTLIEIGEQGVTSLRSACGRDYRIDRDAAGRIVKVVDPAGVEYDVKYHPEGPVQEILRAGRSVLNAAYGPDLESVAVAFADGAVERFTYRGGALVEIVDGQGGKIELRRNAAGQVAAITDAQGRVTEFRVDPETGEPSEIVHADGSVETVETDEDGAREVVAVDGRVHATLSASADGNREEVRFEDGHFVRLDWDGQRLVAAENGESRIALVYDERGRLEEERQGSIAVTYDYDADGNLVRLATSDGGELRYAWNADGLLEKLTDWSGKETRFEHSPQGSVTRIAFPNGIETTTTLNSAGAYASITTKPTAGGRVIVDDQYTFDARDRVASVVRGGFLRRYRYDKAGRLLGSDDTRPNHSERFGYDAVGNRVSVGPLRAKFDARDRVVAHGSERFEHDPIGRMTSRRLNGKTTRYEWNGQGLLTAVVRPDGLRVEFGYDPFGRRIRKTRGDRTTRWLWSGRQVLREWTEQNGQVVERRDFTFYPGEHHPLALTIDGEPHYVHSDRLGSVLAVTDGGGEVVWQGDYSAYGQPHPKKSTVAQPLRFLGQYEDPETGLHYNLFRYYDPRLGRFVSADPLGLAAGSTNFYAFAHGDPVNHTDPEGLIVPLVALGVVAGAAILGGLIGGAISAIRAEPGHRGDAFWKGAKAGAIGGAIGAAAPIIAAAAGASAAVVAAVGVGAAVVSGGVESCVDSGWSLSNFGSGAAIAGLVTVATMGLAAIPPVRQFLSRTGMALGSSVKKLFSRAKPGRLAMKPTVAKVKISKSKYPESARHIEEAQAKGHPKVGTIDRAGAKSNRAEALKDTPTKRGFDRDEYPPAVFKEGGEGASVRHIPPSDNRGAGASMGAQMTELPNGTQVEVIVVD